MTPSASVGLNGGGKNALSKDDQNTEEPESPTPISYIHPLSNSPALHQSLVCINDSRVLVQHCRNGCAPAELYVIIQDASHSTFTPAIVCVGCAFCGRKVHRAKIQAALEAWARHQTLNRKCP